MFISMFLLNSQDKAGKIESGTGAKINFQFIDRQLRCTLDKKKLYIYITGMVQHLQKLKMTLFSRCHRRLLAQIELPDIHPYILYILPIVEDVVTKRQNHNVR